MIFILSFLVSSGGVLVCVSRSPYFSALGLVVVTCGFSGFIVLQGGAFLGLVLFLIYLGGMLVVFAYSAALAAERYPSVGRGQVVLLAGVVGVVVGI